MLTYFKSFILITCFCYSLPVMANESDFVTQREKVITNIQGILSLDSQKEEYKTELKDVNFYPKFQKKTQRAYSEDFHSYVQTLLPYLLKKVKNNDVNGEFESFHKLMDLSKEIDVVVNLSSIEKVSYELLSENLKTEKILRACSHAMSKYGDKKLEMDVQLGRFDGIADRNMDKVIELKNEYSNLRRSVSSTFEK